MIIIFCCALLVLAEIIVLMIMNKRNRRMHERIRAASNIARDKKLEKMLTNPFDPAAQKDNGADCRSFICLTQTNSKTRHEYVYSLFDTITIGRSRNGNMLVLGDGLVSENHCAIYVYQNNVYVRDLNSANGVLVKAGMFKNYQLSGGNAMPIQDGYGLTIGSIEFRVKLFTIDEY